MKNLVLFQKLIKNYEIEFLNHGYFIHTEFMEREKNYVSTFLITRDIEFIKKDILVAHNFFEKNLI